MSDGLGAAGVGVQTQIVLGRCAYAAPGIIRYDPLLLSTDAGWRHILDAKALFPDAGKVFSPEAQGVLPRVGSLWVFTAETNRRYEPGRAQDRFLARDPRSPVQVLDYSNMPFDEVRRQLVEIGLTTLQAQYTDVLVRLRRGACVRLHLFTDDGTGRRRADIDGLDDLPVLKYNDAIAAGGDLDGIRFVVPGRQPHEVIDRVDWSPDHEFLPKALKRIRRASRDGGQAPEAESLTKAAIEAIAHFVRSSGVVSGDADALRRMRQRMSDFLPQFRAGIADLEAIVAALRSFSPVAGMIEAEVTARRTEIEAELRRSLEPVVRAELERRHADAAAQLETALMKATEAETMEVEAVKRVEVLRCAEREVAAALAREVGVVHDMLEALPDDAADRVQVLARRISKALAGTQLSADVVAPATPPWALGTSTETPIIGFDQLRERLESEADRTGLDATDLLALDALLRGGELVVVLDDDGRPLLDAYARCVVGGRVRRFVLDPSIIGLDDLWRQPASGSPTPLARAWTAARAHPDRVVLLAIECMETAPIGFWLPTLLKELHGEARPPNLLVVGSLCAGRWTDRSGASRLVDILAPISQATTADTWMRAAFLATGLEEAEPTTALSVSSQAPLAKQAAGELMARLNEVHGLRSAGAIRAARVFRAARGVICDSAALQLALDVARLASAHAIVGAAADIGTACLGRGVRLLREIVDRATG
ncbi:hypothetical protein ACLF3G_26835 [Falsiroseomonas sp. HC035]|uniref:hypothetical protein n=1 Tax=Falsiroseomonas sp. HC035 TaxID=3390999 RepID=UPI003D320A2B